MRSLALAAAAALAVFATPARATLQIAADFGGTLFSCVDQAACDTNLTAGILAIANTTIGGVDVNGSVQRSLGTPITPGPVDLLSTSSLSIINNSGVAVAITFTVSDTDFFAPVAAWNTSGSGVWELATGSNATLNWYADAGNAQGADSIGDTPGVLIDTFASVAGGPADSFAHNGNGLLAMASPFSMTEQVVGSLAAGGSLLNRGQTQIFSPVPEPATMALLGVGLLGLGLTRRARS